MLSTVPEISHCRQWHKSASRCHKAQRSIWASSWGRSLSRYGQGCNWEVVQPQGSPEASHSITESLLLSGPHCCCRYSIHLGSPSPISLSFTLHDPDNVSLHTGLHTSLLRASYGLLPDPPLAGGHRHQPAWTKLTIYRPFPLFSLLYKLAKIPSASLYKPTDRNHFLLSNLSFKWRWKVILMWTYYEELLL